MEAITQIAQLLIAMGAALGIRESWPHFYKWLKGRQAVAGAEARQDAKVRREYADGWREVSEKLQTDIDAERQERRTERSGYLAEIKSLRREVRKCESRDAKRASLLTRAIDRIRVLAAVIDSIPGTTVPPWSLDDTDVHAALPPDDTGDSHADDRDSTG